VLILHELQSRDREGAGVRAELPESG
jgi:hypothetical protein